MPDTSNRAILDELRDLRNHMDDKFEETFQRVTVVETKIAPLFDNGQPGRISQLEDDIEEMKLHQAKQFGWFAGVAASFELVWHVVSKKLGLQ